ncbi:unnamed protein product [Adineta steineri]|uniref:RING-CH-type domain-containing protein n=1 Tax=Adineta steineri TaxID=433720 RepID=A0A814V479_9BILA|nr:unnamed protein product [Adineta steineri]CAF1183133.1 unnamed protein product [Adineta steineri]
MQCRICLDTDNPNDLISPCLCSGSSEYIHRECLNRWRSENADGRAFNYCNVCQFKYVIETVINDPKADKQRLLKYYLFVTRDLILITLLIQMHIIGGTFVLKALDKNSNNIKNLFAHSINEFVIYYLSAFVMLLAILGFLCLIIVCCAGGSNGCSSAGSGLFKNSGNNGNGIFSVVIIMILIFAFIGIFVGIFLSFMILKKIMKNHTEKLWLRQEAEIYVIQDFQGKKDELDNYRRNLSQHNLE